MILSHSPQASGIFPQSRVSALRTAVLFGAAVALWPLLFLFLPNSLSFAYDQNAYLGGAAALRAGHGYRFEQYIDLPRIGIYPPGYSVWLAVFWESGQPFAVNAHRLELANWVAAGLTLTALAACLAVSEMSTSAAAAVVLAVGTSAVFTDSMAWIRADVMFTGSSCLLALLLTAYEPGRRLCLWWLAAGVLTALLYLLKTTALAYVGALGMFGLLRGDLRRPSRLICFAAPVCPVIIMWLLFTRHIPTYGTYLPVRIAELGGFLHYSVNVGKQAMLYCSGRWLVDAMLSFPAGASTSNAPWLARISFPAEVAALALGAALFAMPVARGIGQGPRHPRDQITLFVLGSFGLLLFLWPFYLGARCAIALIPFLANWLWRGLKSSAAQGAFIALLAVNIPANVRVSYKMIRNYERDSSNSLETLRQAASWINETAGTGALVAAGRDVPLTPLFEYLGRRVLAKPAGDSRWADVDPAEQGNQRAEYVIIDSSRWPVKGGSSARHYFGRWTVMSRLRSTMTPRCGWTRRAGRVAGVRTR